MKIIPAKGYILVEKQKVQISSFQKSDKFVGKVLRPDTQEGKFVFFEKEGVVNALGKLLVPQKNVVGYLKDVEIQGGFVI